jgi:hypothetical protein
LKMIVGFVGLIGSGKDTAADLLVNDFGFKRDSFANTLKDAVSKIFHWDRDMLQGLSAESRAWREEVDDWWAQRLGIPHLTPRWVLQFFGTDVCRDNFSNDIWVASLERKLMQTKDNVVISDVRFANEIWAIKDAGGSIIRLQRGALPEWWDTARYFDSRENAAQIMREKYLGVHASEWAWVSEGEDYVIHNDGTLRELGINLRIVIDRIRPKLYNNGVNIDNLEGVL